MFTKSRLLYSFLHHHCLKMTAVKQCFPVMTLLVSIFRTAEKFESVPNVANRLIIEAGGTLAENKNIILTFESSELKPFSKI